MGRISKLSLPLGDDVMKNICLGIAEGKPDSHAAIGAGVSPGTFYNWKRKFQAEKATSLLQKYNQWYEKAVSVREGKLLAKIQNSRDWKAAAWILERTNPERWARQVDLAKSKEDEKPNNQLEALVTAMEKSARAATAKNADAATNSTSNANTVDQPMLKVL